MLLLAGEYDVGLPPRNGERNILGGGYAAGATGSGAARKKLAPVRVARLRFARVRPLREPGAHALQRDHRKPTAIEKTGRRIPPIWRGGHRRSGPAAHVSIIDSMRWLIEVPAGTLYV